MKALWTYLMALPAALLLSAAADAGEITLVQEGKPNATIITAAVPTVVANLAALELQYHIEKITGALLPITTDQSAVSGNRILVGESDATRKLGIKGDQFDPQEYLIRISEGVIILIGRDSLDAQHGDRVVIDYLIATSRPSEGRTQKVYLPDIFEDQGTCYATYDFLERFCDVRWYGPTELHVVFPQRATLSVSGEAIRRSPAMVYRQSGKGLGRGLRRQEGGPLLAELWNNRHADEEALYDRRLRAGGVNMYTCHSFYNYYERFKESRPEYFAAGGSQLCYTNAALIKQVVADARDYFDGKNFSGQLRSGPRTFFAICPMDNSGYCTCDDCSQLWKKGTDDAKEFFSNGKGSYYWFNFANTIASEIGKTHPDKLISSLAYADYAHYPKGLELESNIVITPCLHSRSYWNPAVKRNDMALYKDWVRKTDRPLYLWNYYCFPNERAAGWNCFPGFSAHSLAEQIRMFHQDGVGGIFLCGIGDQLDYYLSMKMYDDPALEVDDLLAEFFSRFFGAAAQPMKKFYLRIEEVYNNYDNYAGSSPVEGMHQTEKVAWKYLGTAERMAELERLIEQAQRFAVTDLEKQRVGLWKKGVWDYMVDGRRQYLNR